VHDIERREWNKQWFLEGWWETWGGGGASMDRVWPEQGAGGDGQQPGCEVLGFVQQHSALGAPQ
jgi:hypothetical protein